MPDEAIVDEIPAKLYARLGDAMPSDFIASWLSSPIPVLDDETPIALIRAGEIRRVLAVVSDLEYPGVS